MSIPKHPVSPSAGLAARRPRVLIVDDDPDHVDVVCWALSSAGYETEGATGARVALDQLERRSSPDLVLVDLGMPAMDGRQLIGEMKARPELAQIPVVTMSGSRECALVPGAIAHLEKPIDLAHLLETLADCIPTRARNGQCGAEGPVSGVGPTWRDRVLAT